MKYIINPQLMTNCQNGIKVIFTPNMEKVFLLKDVESIIISTFQEATTIDEAISKIKGIFSFETFDAEECENFIRDMISHNLLINA